MAFPVRAARALVCLTFAACDPRAGESLPDGASGLHSPGVAERVVPFLLADDFEIPGVGATGGAVAVSGGTAVAAGPQSAVVYARIDGAWEYEGTLTPSDGSSPSSAAVSGDTVVIGDSNGGSNDAIGAAHVFVRSGGAWSEQVELFPTDGEYRDYFGHAVAASGDTVVVSAVGDDDKGGDAGAVYVYTRTGQTWALQAKLFDPDGAEADGFGSAVALEGDTLLVGAAGDETGSTNSGSVSVFVRTAGTWSFQQTLVPSNPNYGGGFGKSVALSGDTALIGSSSDYVNGTDSGSAYAFVRVGSTWSQQQRLLDPNGGVSGRFFGHAVAVEGDAALVSVRMLSQSSTGAVYVWRRSEGVWAWHEQVVAAGTVANDRFGTSAAFSGGIALIGATGHDEAGSNFGAAYAYLVGEDSDFDDLPDRLDNCPLVVNEGQTDGDGDGTGDACDYGDLDDDGVDNEVDNCPFQGNADQGDDDDDGLGDACDPTDGNDLDGDGTGNDDDNCPFLDNAGQEDADGDGSGDACDTTDGLDVDHDGADNASDNCPFLANATQTDTDGDGTGDACDGFDDTPDPEDTDFDEDGVDNADDNCPFAANETQADLDSDGAGDACDDADGRDIDGDGVLNENDNCAFAVNANQADADGDGIGDPCDATDNRDVDGDDVVNDVDNCAFHANPDQADDDDDGIGDACDGRDDTIDRDLDPATCDNGGASGAWMLVAAALVGARRRAYSLGARRTS